MSDNDIEFVDDDLPQSKGGGRVPFEWPAIVEKLAAEPGKWAIVRRQVTTNGAFYAHAKLRLEGLGCEATTRRVDGELRLYARWPQAAAS